MKTAKALRFMLSLGCVALLATAGSGQARAQAPTGEFLCSTGTQDGQACNSDEDCPGGVCVLAQGVCDGGADDGLYCDCIASNCVASTECQPTFTGVCPGGPNVDLCCDLSRNCADGAACGGAQRVCRSGEYKGFSCLRDSHCPDSECISSGKYCLGGDFSDYACIDNADCNNADGSPGGVCTGSVPDPTGCTGDCNADGEVTVNELILMVNIALGTLPFTACTAGDADGSGEITINEIIAGVNNALGSCPLPPTGAAFLCSAGPHDGQECDTDGDCAPNGVCVLAAGVCDGGPDDGLYCHCTSGTCTASQSCTPDFTGLCQGGPNDGLCCDVDTNCTSAPCAGSQKVCLGGEFKAFACLRDAHCPSSVCASTGKYCDAGDFVDYSCVDDDDCLNTDGSAGGLCVGVEALSRVSRNTFAQLAPHCPARL